jgi:hypothetical protein
MRRSEELRQEIDQTREQLADTAEETGEHLEEMAEAARPPVNRARQLWNAAKAAAGWLRTPRVLWVTGAAVGTWAVLRWTRSR